MNCELSCCFGVEIVIEITLFSWNIRFKVVLGSLFCEKRTGDCVVTKTASVNGVVMSLNSICRAT